MNILTEIKGVFVNVENFFRSDKVKKVEQEIAQVLPVAIKVVQAIDTKLGGNKTVESVTKVLTDFGLPISSALGSGDVNALNNTLANAALVLVTRELGNNSAATNIINTAISVAVSLGHA